MTDGERVFLMIEDRLPAHLPQRLVHAPLVEQPASHAQEADVRRASRLVLPRILVHVHNRKEHGVHMGHRHIHHREIGAQFQRLEKTLVRIQDRRPVRIDRRNRGIARGGKIILPREVDNARPRLLSKRTRAVRRARIDNNALVRIDCCILQPRFHIARIIAHKDRRSNAQLLRTRRNAPPDRHAPPERRAHLFGKEGRLRHHRRRRRRKCPLCCRNRLRVSVVCCKRLRQLCVHLGQLGEIAYRLLRHGEALLPARRMLAIEAQENPIGTRGIDNGAASKRNVAQGIVLRHAFIAEIVIGLRKIAPTALGVVGVLCLRKQETKISLPLLLRECSRVSRMDKSQQLRCNGTGRRRRAVRLAQFLVNAPHIVSSRAAAENARCIGVKQGFSRCLVDIVPRHKEHFESLCIHLRNHGAQRRARLCREIFIRIDEYNPLPCRTLQCGIARSGKIIRPRNLIDSSTIGYGNAARIILRSRIDDNQLIHGITQTLNRRSQMPCIIPYNIARRDTKPLFLHNACLPAVFFCPQSPIIRLHRCPQMCIDLRNALRHDGCHRVIEERAVMHL